MPTALRSHGDLHPEFPHQLRRELRVGSGQSKSAPIQNNQIMRDPSQPLTLLFAAHSEPYLRAEWRMAITESDGSLRQFGASLATGDGNRAPALHVRD